jgi:sphingomyelin phosphodiesterase 2
MRKVFIGVVAIIVAPVLGLMAFVTIMSFFNGRVGANVDFSKSAFKAQPPAPLTKPLMLKVVTFNIQDTMVVGWNRPTRMRAIGRILTKLDPDLVGFQEAFIASDRKVLMDALRESRLQYAQYFDSGTVGCGVFIASAFPIKEAYFHRYSTANPWYKLWEGDWWAGKGVGLARVELPNGLGMLDFYSTHAQAGYGNQGYRLIRQTQMTELAKFINDTRMGTVPTLITGDFNCRPGQDDFQQAMLGANLMSLIQNGEHQIDHILGVSDAKYRFEVLDTFPIAEKVPIDGSRVTDLSDHNGYISTVRIGPAN